MPSKWTHPIHAKGVRSPDLTKLSRGKPLSDRQIRKYALEGRYGEEVREQYEGAKRTKRKPQQTLLERALNKLLGLK